MQPSAATPEQALIDGLAEKAHRSRTTFEIRGSRGLLDLDLSAVWRYRELLYFLVLRELTVRYKQAALGVGWAIVQPLFAVLIFTLVFGMFAKIPSEGIPYPVFALAATLPWTYFAEAMRRSGLSLVSDADLVRKVYFPRLILPLAGVITPLADFCVAFIVLLLMMAWYGIMPTWHIVLLPLFLMLAMGLAFATGLWLGPINVRYRDIMHTLPFVVQVWMYASPIVYPVSMVPAEWRALYSLNPMVGVIEGFRWALLGTASPNLMSIGIGATIIVLATVAGIIFFKKKERAFADVI
jgi:lipopolysaccharide transport system permease protein